MAGQRPGGIPGWVSPEDEPAGRTVPAPGQAVMRRREPPYVRSMAWAFGLWVVAVGVVYVVAQVLGKEQFGGYLGLAGFVLGIWLGGIRGGITGSREWAVYVLILLAVASFVFGVAGCVAAMLIYG